MKPPQLSTVMRTMGEKLPHGELVQIRSFVLGQYSRDNTIAVGVYAETCQWWIEEKGATVAYIMGMDRKRFMKKAREIHARYVEAAE